MKHPKLRDSHRLNARELYPTNEIPDDVVTQIGAHIIYLLALGRKDITGTDWGDTLALALQATHLDSPIGIADVVREKMGKNSFTKITEKGLNEIDEIYEAWRGITEKIEELVGDKTYLERTKKSFKEFVEILGKDKKYDKVSEEFDFWII